MTLRVIGTTGFLLLLIVIISMFGKLSFFIDLPTLIIVLGAGFFMALGATTKNRLDMFAKGSVRGGWIGFIIGLVMIVNTVELSNLKMLSPALSVLFLCPLYGYIISYIVNNLLEKNEG